MMTYLLFVSACFLFFSISAAEVYYVKSRNDTKGCPLQGECQTLSYYTRNASQYFHDNADFIFLEGVHMLEGSLVINGVSDISLVGGMNMSENDATTTNATVITCINETGNIVFSNYSNNILIKFITINNCGSNDTSFGSAALFLYEVFDVTLEYMTVKRSVVNGLVIINGYGVQIKNSTFTYNSRANAVLNFTSPLECSLNESLYNVSIMSSIFSSGRIGLLIGMKQQSTFLITTFVDSIIAYNNSICNIIFAMLDGQLHAVSMKNVSSSYAYTGLLLWIRNNEKFDTRNICPTVTFSMDESIIFEESDFSNNVQGIYSSAVFFVHLSLHMHIEKCTFNGNQQFALHFDKHDDNNVDLRIEETEIHNNSFNVNKGSLDAAIIVYCHDVLLQNVIFSNNMNGGLLLLHSKSTFSGSNNEFYNNSAINGGAISLFHSDMIFMRNSTVSFANNTAERKGGAIYIDQVCAFHIPNFRIQDNRTINNVTLNFVGNKAKIANDIYGLNSPSHCFINVENLADVIHFSTDSEELFSLSTNSAGVCKCDLNDTIYSFSKCFNETHDEEKIVMENMTVYPGEFLNYSVAVVGYGRKGLYSFTDGIIDLIVNGSKKFSDSKLFAGTGCHMLEYQLFQAGSRVNSTETIVIESEPNYLNVLTSIHPLINISVEFLQCPVGFQLNKNGICDCAEILKNTFEVECDITNRTITVKRTVPNWYGTIDVNDNKLCYIDQAVCVHDYCVHSEIKVNLNETDVQCNSHRSGILCSHCLQGKSLKLGSNDCDNCENSFIAMLILFIFAGIGLIGLIIILNLTVSVGAINGLIFYANILKIHEHIFFPEGPVPFVSQFISWINLDFGFNMCFYNGMDTYSKAWLQFVFPFYIWALIIIIIVLCHWSMKISRLFGSHIVPVLATILLLSYIKLMRSIVYALSVQYISVTCINDDDDSRSSNHFEWRWYPDPSIRYLELKHAFLFVFALFILILLVIPYTVMLLIGPVLEGYISRYRWCSIWNKLKPVFDAYNAPFKDSLRFWTGFLLVARLPIIAFGSVFHSSETDKNALFSVVLVTLAIIITTANICRGVYRIWYLDVLESVFLLNLALVTIVANYQINSHEYNIYLILSVCFSFILFVGIIIFHVYLRFSKGGSQETELKMQALAKMSIKQKGIKEVRKKQSCTSDQGIDNHLNEMKETNNSRTAETSFTDLRKRETLLCDDGHSDYVFVTDSSKAST